MSESRIKLKDCPFCGSSDVQKSSHSDLVICKNCRDEFNKYVWVPLSMWQTRPESTGGD